MSCQKEKCKSWNSPDKLPPIVNCATLSPSPKRRNDTELVCKIKICKGWNSADIQPPPVAPHVQQEDLEGETVPQYPEHIARMCYDWEKISEERRMKAEGEEKEKFKRFELKIVQRDNSRE